MYSYTHICRSGTQHGNFLDAGCCFVNFVNALEITNGKIMASIFPTDYPIAIFSLPREKQGEAIALASDGSGFYTTSEYVNQPIYFYGFDDRDASSSVRHVASFCVIVMALALMGL